MGPRTNDNHTITEAPKRTSNLDAFCEYAKAVKIVKALDLYSWPLDHDEVLAPLTEGQVSGANDIADFLSLLYIVCVSAFTSNCYSSFSSSDQSVLLEKNQLLWRYQPVLETVLI